MGSVALETVRETDADFIFRLRTDPELGKYLSPAPGSVGIQREWIRAYLTREAAAEEYYFVICRNGERVGTIRLHDLLPPSFSWGSWLIARGTDHRVAPASVVLLYDFAFDDLRFARSQFRVSSGNSGVRQFHLAMGATIVRSEAGNDFFEITREIYFQVRGRLVGMAGVRG